MICALVVTALLAFMMLKDKKLTQSELDVFTKWVKYMMVEAEDMFGPDTGQAKLYYVYSRMAEKFPAVAEVVTLEELSDYISKVKKSDAWKKIARAAGIEVE